MKRLLILCIAAFLFLNFQLAASVPWLPMTRNVIYEYEITNGKGKVTGYRTVSVKSMDNNGMGLRVELAYAQFDKNRRSHGQQIPSSKYYVDSERVLLLKESYEIPIKDDKYTLNVYGDDVVYPLSPQVGDILPGYAIVMHMDYIDKDEVWNNEGNTTILRSLKREVTGAETVETPVGAYDCIVTEEIIVNEDARGKENIYSKKTWYSDGVGEVRSERYNHNNVLVETNRLVSILELN